MTLGSALNIGRSGLLASQTALTVTGNNLANLATRGYHKQEVSLSPIGDKEIQRGQFLGQGVQIDAITRRVNDALEGRLREAISQEGGSSIRQELLAQIEAIENEFTDIDLSSRLQSFFNSWSQLSNNPQDLSLRTLVTEEAASLTNFLVDMRSSFTELQTQTDAALGNSVDAANDILQRIEVLNQQIAQAEGGSASEAMGLRDQRELLLADLAKYLDISTVEQANGAVDVFVGSLPIVLNGESRGLDVRNSLDADGNQLTEVIIAADGSALDLSTGQLGGYIDFRNEDLLGAIDTLDTFANQLIFQTNRVHSQGQPLRGFDSVRGTTRISDPTLELTDPTLELDFSPQHGSFEVHLTQKSTGERLTSVIDVDLDGIGASDTLNSLVTKLDGVPNLTATVNGDGTVTLTADTADFAITFSEDSTGVLAVLGINTFFTGADATDIAVNEVVQNPNFVAAALEHLPGDNRSALGIAALRDAPVEELDGLSLTQFWGRHVEDYAIRLAQTRVAVEADGVVKEALVTQQQSLSGVNADEETINLIQFQRAFQANARFINVVDEMIQTLLALA